MPYLEEDGVARALPSLSRCAFPGSGTEQATSELVNYYNNDRANSRELWLQLVAPGAFQQWNGYVT